MINPQRNQQVRGQIGIHVGVQVRPELALPENVGLDDGFGDVQLIILRLAHQRLREGGDGRFHLDAPVRIDIGHLCPAEAENIDLFVVCRDVARHPSADHQQTVVVI